MILWRKGLGFSSNLSNLSIFPPDINDPASHSVKWSLGIVWSKKIIRSCLHRHHQTGSLISDQKINKLDSFELKPTPFNLLFTKSFFLTSDSLVAETKSCLHLNFYSCCCCRRHCYTLNSVDHSPSSSLQPWFYCIRTAELISMNSIFVFWGRHKQPSSR